MGPTASGKTKLSIELYKHIDSEIISVDSTLIYRYLNIGTNKPNKKILKKIKHHLINICDPNELYSVVKFYNSSNKLIDSIIKNNKTPLFVGGSMFYFKSLIEGVSNNSYNLYLKNYIKKYFRDIKNNKFIDKVFKMNNIEENINIKNKNKMLRILEILSLGEKYKKLKKNNVFEKFDLYQFAVYPKNKKILNKKIEKRFYKCLSEGFENEVYNLFKYNILSKNMPAMKCIGYKTMFDYINNNISYKNMIKKCLIKIKQLSKKQMTWLKKWNKLIWLNNNNLSLNIDVILKKLKN